MNKGRSDIANESLNVEYTQNNILVMWVSHLRTELQNNIDLRLSILQHFPAIKHNLLIFPEMS